MTPQERATLHALTDAVADDENDVHATFALADFLEEKGHLSAAGKVRRLIPQDVEILVIRWERPEQRELCQRVLNELTTWLREQGKAAVGVGMPKDISLDFLRPSEATHEMLRQLIRAEVRGPLMKEIVKTVWEQPTAVSMISTLPLPPNIQSFQVMGEQMRTVAGAPRRPLCSNGCCVECEACAAKSGTPLLCAACLRRRAACIERHHPLRPLVEENP